ncbi:hypothetical protein BT_0387 [Bartonella tribocorum CIP 105476]|uniref:Uncharacterized protein n=1 Tax=Bartonella tribocorum (strain DSM 28219 / CCUG 45778 / CIP 105476 / IBS 506) TaxID=382640 RepID=A9INW0_BART1|nr:hypothetical protein BT_0387 [Bartonella tribocorum CIP 105476]
MGHLAQICDNARIYGKSNIDHQVKIYDNAVVNSHSKICNYIYDDDQSIKDSA